MDGHQTASRRVFKAPSDTPRGHQVGPEATFQYYEDISTLVHLYIQEHKDFWATYKWDENPWIVDSKERMLRRRSIHCYTPAR